MVLIRIVTFFILPQNEVSRGSMHSQEPSNCQCAHHRRLHKASNEKSEDDPKTKPHPAERYFHRSRATLSLLSFSSWLTSSTPAAMRSSLASRHLLTFHAIAATAAYRTALTSCSATIASQILARPPVPAGHSLRWSGPLELRLPTQDPRNMRELANNTADNVAENHSASRGGLTRASTCRCSEGIVLKKHRPGTIRGWMTWALDV